MIIRKHVAIFSHSTGLTHTFVTVFIFQTNNNIYVGNTKSESF